MDHLKPGQFHFNIRHSHRTKSLAIMHCVHYLIVNLEAGNIFTFFFNKGAIDHFDEEVMGMHPCTL